MLRQDEMKRVSVAYHGNDRVIKIIHTRFPDRSDPGTLNDAATSGEHAFK